MVDCFYQELFPLINAVEACTEDLYNMATQSTKACSVDLDICQWWINGINNPNTVVVDHLRQLENRGVGKIQVPTGNYQSVTMKQLHPHGTKTEVFQDELKKLKRYDEASTFLANNPFQPVVATMFLDSLLRTGLLGAKTDKEVDELLAIDTIELNIPTINHEQDNNAEVAPAEDAAALDAIFALDVSKTLDWIDGPQS